MTSPIRPAAEDSLHGVASTIDDPQKADSGVRSQTFTPATLSSGRVSCDDPACHDGGLIAAGIIEQRAATGVTVLEVASFCGGYQGSPKGAVKISTCGWMFEWRAEVRLRSGGGS